MVVLDFCVLEMTDLYLSSYFVINFPLICKKIKIEKEKSIIEYSWIYGFIYI